MSKRVVAVVAAVLGVLWIVGACDGDASSSASPTPESVATVAPVVSTPSDVDMGVVPDDGVVLTPCDDEDGGVPVSGADGCYWDASESGNGRGSDVIVWWTHR